MIIVTSSFSISSVYKMFSVHSKTRSQLFQLNSSGLKSVFEKLCFRDGLVCCIGLTVEIKLSFQISSACCGREFSYSLFLFDFSLSQTNGFWLRPETKGLDRGEILKPWNQASFSEHRQVMNVSMQVEEYKKHKNCSGRLGVQPR